MLLLLERVIFIYVDFITIHLSYITSNLHPSEIFVIGDFETIFLTLHLGIFIVNLTPNFIFLDIILKY
jgi:hypothetical protein